MIYSYNFGQIGRRRAIEEKRRRNRRYLPICQEGLLFIYCVWRQSLGWGRPILLQPSYLTSSCVLSVLILLPIQYNRLSNYLYTTIYVCRPWSVSYLLGWNHFFWDGHFMGLAKIYRKRPKILALWPFQGCKAKKNLKLKYGSKCLELFNSARNAKIAKKIQKVPNEWSTLKLAFKGLILEI